MPSSSQLLPFIETVVPPSMRPASRILSWAERGLVQNALGPEERLLAMLRGSDARGSVTWLATNARLVMLSHARPDDHSATVTHAAVTCVELRSDPMGTWLRVRATGQQYCIMNVEAAQVAQFCAVLRERAGIDAPTPARRSAPARDSLRTVFTGLTSQSPR